MRHPHEMPCSGAARQRLTGLLLAAGAVVCLAAAEPETEVFDPGVTRGICVILGDTRADLALRLAATTELQFYLQFPEAKTVESVRRRADEAGLLGSRIFVEQGPADRLHPADNMADALLALSDAGPPEPEALRVVRPEGRVVLGRRLLTKPFPAGVDNWSHPYHGPDNNPLSRDEVARGPYLTQFLADPRYAPLPQVAVASGGRIFKAFGHIAFKKREEPWLNTLAAFNGFNGTLLWRQPIAPALMVHRNNIIATPARLYYGDDTSCKIYEASTGRLIQEIRPAASRPGETFWKWMALENGVLYAVLGDQEDRDPTIRANNQGHGWPWNPLSPGFNKEEHTWGFGRTVIALDAATHQELWRHQEAEPVDTRAVCMKSGRLYLFRFGAYLACLDTSTGREVWRKTPRNAPELFRSLGEYSKRQDWRTNWRTTAYVKCSDKALYFAGPTINKLLAVSTENGRVLWEHPYDNYQVVLREDGLYGIGGQIDQDPARVFDPLTGKVLREIPLGRRACTRVTGSIDALFCRASGGSSRLDTATGAPQLLSPMRPNCHDGVTMANGLLYWWPSVCDCNLTLYGITCLGPAGEFDFTRPAQGAERLETRAAAVPPGIGLEAGPADWPMFRANPLATVTSEAPVPSTAAQRWEARPATAFVPTAPTAVGRLVFVAGNDGAVRAFDAESGRLEWKAFTGGEVRYPPSIWNGRAYVGSGDGYAYCFEAATGALLWRFRAAPVERRIPVYGKLQSTWPVASGVLVKDGVAYFAAGIVNYDGTHVYAVDARSGRLIWQNNTSGQLQTELHTGVSVQGHMVILGQRLYLAGGNVVSPAIYDLRDGTCLNDPLPLKRRVNNNVPGSFAPRGNELYCLGGKVLVSGKPHYAHPDYPVYDAEVLNKTLLTESGDRAVAWVNNAQLMAFRAGDPNVARQILSTWTQPRKTGLTPLWQTECKDSLALAVTPKTAVVALHHCVTAFDLSNGHALWTCPLPAPPVPWGMAATRSGLVVVSLQDGRVLGLGPADAASRQQSSRP